MCVFFSRGVKESKGAWYKKHPKNHSYSNHQFSGAKLVCGECKLLLKRGLQRCAGIKEAHRWEPRKNSPKRLLILSFFFGWVAHPSSTLFYIKEHKPHSLGKNGVPHHFGFRKPQNQHQQQTNTLAPRKKIHKKAAPSRFEGGSPPCGFFFCFGTVGAINPVTTSIQVYELPLLWLFWISTAPIGKFARVFVVSASLGEPSTHRWTLRHSSGRGVPRGDDAGHRASIAQWLNCWTPRGAWNFSLKAQQPNSKVPGSVSKGGEAGDSFRQNSWRRLEGTHEP